MTIEQADSRAGTYPHPTLSSSNPNFNIETQKVTTHLRKSHKGQKKKKSPLSHSAEKLTEGDRAEQMGLKPQFPTKDFLLVSSSLLRR